MSRSYTKCQFIPWTAASLPLLQTLIYVAGARVNTDLLNQFSLDPGHRDSWFDLEFSIAIMGAGQSFNAVLLGAISLFALTRTPERRRVAFLGMSGLGVSFFAWLRWNNWNFAGNHCGPDGCDDSSPLPFDFPMVVYFGLPLLWNVGVFFYSLMLRNLLKTEGRRPSGANLSD